MLLDPRLSTAILSLLLVWLVAVSFLFSRFFRHYQRLTKGVSKKDFRSVFEKIIKDLDLNSKKIRELTKEIEKVKKEGVHDIQKIGLVRFNPFAETGGDQSFCLTILDAEDSGLVISSLHSRDTTRLYAKPVRKGKSVGYQLSTEERKAIKEAKRIK